MRRDESALIRNLPLFVDMEDASFDLLMRAAYFQRFPASVELIAEGEGADFLHIVVEGAVVLYTAHGDRETVMEIVHPITTFILAAAVREQPHLMSARTLEASRILMVPSMNVRAIFEEDPVFARAIIRELARGYRTMVKALKDQKLRTSAERLANYLIRGAAEQGGEGGFRLRIEKRMLASLLGMTPENLSRAFATLSRCGVFVDGAQIQLTSLNELKAFARPTPLIDDPAS